MKHSILCDPYFWESPLVLFQTGLFFCTNTVCLSEHINHITLLTLLFILSFYVSHKMFKTYTPLYNIGALIAILAFPSVLEIYRINNPVESFKDVSSELPCVILTEKNIQSSPVSYPSARNPLMNVLVDEIRYNPGRPPAASVLDPSVKVSLDDFFKTEFTRDPTDVFGRSQSQREFITMPSTSIPNDVESYQNWLYKIPGKTCKEGGRESCLPGTDGHIPWMNN